MGEINYHCCHLPRGTCTTRACSGGSSSVAAHSSPLPCLPAGAKLSTTSSARRGEPGQRLVAITVNSLSLPSVRCERAFHPHHPLRCRDTPAFGALHHAKTCLLPLCGSAELAHHEASSCCQRVARAASQTRGAVPACQVTTNEILACIEGAWKRCKPLVSIFMWNTFPPAALLLLPLQITPPSKELGFSQDRAHLRRRPPEG